MINKKIKKTSYTPFRRMYEFISKKGERVVVEISETHCNPKDKKCLPNLWVKHGYVKKAIYDYLSCQVYVYSEIGCIGDYNPTVTKEHKINFKWLLPVSKANEEKIVNEVYRLAHK